MTSYTITDVLNSIPAGYTVLLTYEKNGLPAVDVIDEFGRRCTFTPDVPFVPFEPRCLEYLRYDYELLRVRDVNAFVSISSRAGELLELRLSLQLHSVSLAEIDFIKQGSLTIQIQSLDALARGTLNKCLNKDEYSAWRKGLLAFIREQLDRHGVVFPAKK